MFKIKEFWKLILCNLPPFQEMHIIGYGMNIEKQYIKQLLNWSNAEENQHWKEGRVRIWSIFNILKMIDSPESESYLSNIPKAWSFPEWKFSSKWQRSSSIRWTSLTSERKWWWAWYGREFEPGKVMLTTHNREWNKQKKKRSRKWEDKEWNKGGRGGMKEIKEEKSKQNIISQGNNTITKRETKSYAKASE